MFVYLFFFSDLIELKLCLVLDPKIRLYFSLGLMVFAGIGLYAGDIIVPLTEEEKEANELAK